MSYFRVAVSEPVKANDKFGPYIVYRVTMNTDWAGYPPSEFSVNRRYSDFDWVSKEFSYILPGTFVPALPEKQTVGRFNSEFVESRQRGFEKFLTRVTSRPILAPSPLLKNFLTADEHELLRMKEEAKASKKKITDVAKSFFDKTFNSLTNSGKAEVEKTQEDLQIEEIQAYITAFEKHLHAVVSRANSLVQASRVETTCLFEFGTSLKAMADSESGPLSASLQQVGTTADASSVSGTAYNDSQTSRMLEPLEEFSLLVGSVNRALKQRSVAREAYVDALTDVEVKQTAFNKTAGPNREAKQQAVIASQAAADLAKTELQTITDRIVNEFEAFKAFKVAELQQVMQEFSIMSLERHRKGEEVWNQIVAPSSTAFPSVTASRGYSAPLMPPTSSSNPFGGIRSQHSSGFQEEEVVGV